MTVLINAPWQASGCGHRYPIGAERIRSMLASSIDLTIPNVTYEAGAFDVTQGIRNHHEVLDSLDLVNDSLSEFTTPLYNLGCDCGGELVPIARLNQSYGGDLRVIWFDAHPDLNTVETSDSHTFHGMVLRALLGDKPPQFSSYLPAPLKPENVILAGVRSFDPAEQQYIGDNQLALIAPEALNEGVELEQLAALKGGPVFVHVDYDVLDPQRHQSAVFKERDGVALSRLLEWLQAIRKEFDVVGFGLTEFAPSSILAGDEDVKALLSSGFGLSLK
jgi:arginase